MTEGCAVLRFEHVAYRARDELHASFRDAAFTLRAGELMGVHIDHDNEHVPLADLATGLLEPTSGCVRFRDRDWREMNAFEQAEARGRIGCVLETRGWISNLTVLQNLTLRERHHTTRSESEIADETAQLCRLAGLAGVPKGRPDWVRPRELRVLEWVRAFMGTPDLVVLMFPERDAFSGGCEACSALVGRARAAGSAVVWLSDRPEIWDQPFMAEAEHYEIKDERWMPRGRNNG